MYIIWVLNKFDNIIAVKYIDYFVTETYYCLLKLRSSIEETGIRMQPGSGETRVLYVSSLSL